MTPTASLRRLSPTRKYFVEEGRRSGLSFKIEITVMGSVGETMAPKSRHHLKSMGAMFCMSM